MCGIIGYTGALDAKKVVLQGLEQLEYRGYDSAGMALQTDDNHLFLMKEAGPVAVLKETSRQTQVRSHCGIGHTRWATHGGVTDTNAHPHTAGKVTLIHNGIIENYHEIVERFSFHKDLQSETDTEVAAWLVNHFYTENEKGTAGDPYRALCEAVRVIKGSYAFCVLFEDIPGNVFAIRNVSPLVAASSSVGSFIASDLTALISYTRQYFVVPENHVVMLEEENTRIFDLNGQEEEPEMLEVNWDTEAAQKGGYPHFMIKEINEQPEALERTIKPRLKDGLPDFAEENVPDSLFLNCDKIDIVACGTAMYAGMVGKSLLEPMLKIPVSVNIASEFRYEQPLLDEKTLTIIISQSGETIDTLAALRLAKEHGSRTLAIVNVKGSTIARESDYVLYTHAGPEIAVASTKAYSVQLAVLYLLTCRMALVRKRISEEEAKAFMEELLKTIPAIRQVLEDLKPCKHVSERMVSARNAFFIGRGLDYAFSLEGALKLKEISYIHAEAYAAGELKHGTIALIEKNTPVVAIATQEHIFAKTISNIREVKARDAYVILITKEDAEVSPEVYDIHIKLPKLSDRFTVFPVAVILQLIAYYTSDGKGLNVDKPRNLAKSVTVE